MLQGSGPIGVVLAGGRGRRMGGDKAGVLLHGRPLAQWVVNALGAVLDDVVVACRMESMLPPLSGVKEAWIPARAPRGPVAALAAALQAARGRDIVACGLALPLVWPRTVQAIAFADARGAPAVVPEAGGRLEAELGRWSPAALPLLERLPPDATLEAAVHAVGGARLPLPEAAAELTRIDAPEDLLRLDRDTLSRRWTAASPS